MLMPSLNHGALRLPDDDDDDDYYESALEDTFHSSDLPVIIMSKVSA